MAEIVEFLSTFIAAPITTVISLSVVAGFIYWFIIIRPKEKESQNKIMAEYSSKLGEYKETIVAATSNYDKTLSLCTRVIENNTQVIETIKQSMAVNTKVLEEYVDTNNKINEKIEIYQKELIHNQHNIQLKIAEM